MRTFIQTVPLFPPAVALAVVAALALAPPLARFLAARRQIAFLLVLSTGTIAAATLTPLRTALDGTLVPRWTCDLGRIVLADIRGDLMLDDSGLNILLFVPLGVALGLLPRSRRSTTFLIAAAVSPLLIELTQLLVWQFGRSCQSGDVVDNLTGLAIGLVVGMLGGWTLGRFLRQPVPGPSL